MRMIAIGTVHGRKTIRARNENDPKDRGQYTEVVVQPGREFDSETFGMSDEDVQQLVASGAAKRKTREVQDDTAAAEPARAGAPKVGSPVAQKPAAQTGGQKSST